MKARGESGASRVRQERSAGVVLFREDRKAGRVYLLLDYGRHWDYPKGHVEAGEADKEAAARELDEETGIEEVEILEGFVHEIIYFFRHPKRGLIRKTVVFFLARTNREYVNLSDEHEGFAWLSGPEAMKRLTYRNAREVLAAALRFQSKAGDGE